MFGIKLESAPAAKAVPLELEGSGQMDVTDADALKELGSIGADGARCSAPIRWKGLAWQSLGW